MADFTIEIEWTDAEGVGAPELRATWCRLSLYIDESPIIKVVDSSSQTLRNSIFVPLYPLAEWLALNWWQLFYEVESPFRERAASYESRHSVRMAREGFAFPPLFILPGGEETVLRWESEDHKFGNLEFIGQGEAYLDSSGLRDTFSSMLRGVVTRLEDLGIDDTILQEEWRTLTELSAEEREFCQVAGALGLDPYSVDEWTAEQVIEAADRLPQALVRDFFDTVQLDNLVEQADSIRRSFQSIIGTEYTLEGLEAIHGLYTNSLNGEYLPWEEGYLLARNLRDFLDLDGQPIDSFSALATSLDLASEDLEDVVQELPTIVSNTDALLAYNAHSNPGVAVQDASAESVRFSLCRSICEVSIDSGDLPSLVTKARNHRQQRNRAFAAEFLLPASVLNYRIRERVVDQERIDAIAEEYGVASLVVQHQLENHNIARALVD